MSSVLGWEPVITVPSGSVSGGASPPGSWVDSFLLCLHISFPLCAYREGGRGRQRERERALLSVPLLIKPPLSDEGTALTIHLTSIIKAQSPTTVNWRLVRASVYEF